MNNLSLKNRVMIRIYLEFVRNSILKRIEYILPGAFLLALFASVSTQNIVNNMPKDNFSHTFNFFFVAVRDTEWAIQGVVVALTVWACFAVARLAYQKFPWKKLDFLKYFGLLRIRY